MNPRSIKLAIVACLIVALIAPLVFWSTIAEVGYVETTQGAPADFQEWAPDRQEKWIQEHTQRITGLRALLHKLQNPIGFVKDSWWMSAIVFVFSLTAFGAFALLLRISANSNRTRPPSAAGE